MSFEVSEIRRFEEFLGLEAEWNQLLARSSFDAPFLRHEWLTTWWRHFSPDGRLAILLAREGGRLVLALPLMEQKTRFGPFPLTVLRSLTNTHSFRYHLLLEKGQEDALADIWSYLLRRDRPWHMVVLTDVPMDVGLHEPLLDHVRSHGGLAGVWHALESAYLACEGTWENHEQKIAKSVRKRLRNQRNRLKRQGEVRLEVLTQPEEVVAALPEAFEIERRGWKGDRGTAIACNPALVGFYTDFARIAAQCGWMRLIFLRAGEIRTAFEYSIEYGQKHYSIKIGYDAENFARFSAGRLCVMESLARCFEEQLAEYDFIGPLTPAHAEWKPQTREIGWIFLYRKTIPTRLHYFVKFVVKPLAKRILQRLGLLKRHAAGG